MPSDPREIDRLDSEIVRILKEIAPDREDPFDKSPLTEGEKLKLLWHQKTRALMPTRLCLREIETCAEVFKRCGINLTSTIIQTDQSRRAMPFWHLRRKWRAAKMIVQLKEKAAQFHGLADLAMRLAAEVSKDVDMSAKDVFSVLKVAEEMFFYDKAANRIEDLGPQYWPMDRFDPKAEMVTMNTYLVDRKDGADDLSAQSMWRHDLEAWRQRAVKECPKEIKQRIGARRI